MKDDWIYSTLPINIALGPVGTFVQLYILTLHGTVIDIGLATTLFNAVTIPAAMIWGYATDRSDRRKPIIVLSYLAVAGTLILSDRKITNAMSPNLARLWHHKGLSAKIGSFLESVSLPKTQIARMYGMSPDSPSIYLYYPVRLKDVLSRYWRMALHLFRGDPALTSLAKRKVILQNWLSEG